MLSRLPPFLAVTVCIIALLAVANLADGLEHAVQEASTQF